MFSESKDSQEPRDRCGAATSCSGGDDGAALPGVPAAPVAYIPLLTFKAGHFMFTNLRTSLYFAEKIQVLQSTLEQEVTMTLHLTYFSRHIWIEKHESASSSCGRCWG